MIATIDFCVFVLVLTNLTPILMLQESFKTNLVLYFLFLKIVTQLNLRACIQNFLLVTFCW